MLPRPRHIEPGPRVTTRGFEQPVAGGLAREHRHERAVHQAPDEVDRASDVERFVGDGTRGGLEREAAGEGAQAVEHALLGGREQPVAPVECGLQHAVALATRPAGEFQEPQSVVKVCEQRREPKGRHAAAASSTASGLPSSLRQISSTSAVLPGASEKRWSACAARCANSATASEGATDRGGRPLRPAGPAAIWLVTRTRRPRSPAASTASGSASATARCSAPSSTSSAAEPASARPSAANRSPSPVSETPSASAIAEGTRSISSSGSSATQAAAYPAARAPALPARGATSRPRLPPRA